MNMSDLDDLNKKLKDSMTVLGVQGASDYMTNQPQRNQDSPDFAK